MRTAWQTVFLVCLSSAIACAAQQVEVVWSSEGKQARELWPIGGGGRIQVKSGEAWLRTVLVDAKGAALPGTGLSPKVLRKDRSTYVATQAPVSSPEARGVRIELLTTGRAAVEDARPFSYSPALMANAEFEMPLDAKKRIPMWNEETLDALYAGKRGGAISLEPPAVSSGGNATQALSIVPSGDWAAASSLNYPVPAWAGALRGRVSARCAPSAAARVLLVWTDDGAQNVLRVDTAGGPRGEGWHEIATLPEGPPDGATQVRLVLLASKGQVWFDDAALVTDPAGKHIAKVLVNQAGYDRKGPKSAVVMTNFFPANDAVGVIRVNRQLSMPIKCSGRIAGENAADWGWFFWRVDFTALDTSGTFTLEAKIGDVKTESVPFNVRDDAVFTNTADLCVDFFFVQRCGFAVSGWHAACHLDDAKLTDGTHRDLTGGWHSAGDYNKISWEYGDGGVMYALVRAYLSAPKRFTRDRDGDGLVDVLDEARWGADYLAKLQNPETGGFYYHIQQGPDRQTWMKWCPPEAQTDGMPGTADDPIVQPGGEGNSPLAIGGWALLGKLLNARGVRNTYLSHAERNWEYETSKSPDGTPLLLISTIDLFDATGEPRYHEFARHCAEQILKNAPAQGLLKGGYADSGDLPAAALARFAQAAFRDRVSDEIRERLKSHIAAFVDEPRNPFGLTHQKFGADGHFFEPTSALGHNYEYLCRAWSALEVYKTVRDQRALRYALDQLNFVLGCNPYNLCMFEGAGAINPPRYHHRYITIPGHERGAVPGAIPNGFVRDVSGLDRPGFDMSIKGRQYPSYRTSEPWLVHNVFYLLAVTSLHDIAAANAWSRAVP